MRRAQALPRLGKGSPSDGRVPCLRRQPTWGEGYRRMCVAPQVSSSGLVLPRSSRRSPVRPGHGKRNGGRTRASSPSPSGTTRQCSRRRCGVCGREVGGAGPGPGVVHCTGTLCPCYSLPPLLPVTLHRYHVPLLHTPTAPFLCPVTLYNYSLLLPSTAALYRYSFHYSLPLPVLCTVTPSGYSLPLLYPLSAHGSRTPCPLNTTCMNPASRILRRARIAPEHYAP